MHRSTGRRRAPGADAMAPAVLAAMLLAAACGPGKPPPVGPDGGRDGGRRDGGGSGPTWEVVTVDTGNVGRNISMTALPTGEVAAAYYATAAVTQGPCDSYGGQEPFPDETTFDLHYAIFAGGTWSVEKVAEPIVLGEPQGLMLKVAPDGRPVIAATTGDPYANGPILYCGVNDAGLYRRSAGGGWTVETVATDSGQAASGDPASDFGYVVGMWPSVAFGPSGEMLYAWKDVHAGGLQSDDFRRADVEVRLDGAFHVVDLGRGGGEFTNVTWDRAGRPVVVFYNSESGVMDSPQGIWAKRSADGGQTWEEVRLHVGATSERPQVLVDGDGRLTVVFYDAQAGKPKVATLSDDAAFTEIGAWDFQTFGDNRYDEGYFPSATLDPDGNLAVAYYRCARATKGLGNCDPNDDGVILAWRDGTFWDREIVDEGEGGNCGEYASLAFDGSGRVVVAYRCSVQLADGSFEFQVHAASRPWP